MLGKSHPKVSNMTHRLLKLNMFMTLTKAGNTSLFPAALLDITPPTAQHQAQRLPQTPVFPCIDEHVDTGVYVDEDEAHPYYKVHFVLGEMGEEEHPGRDDDWSHGEEVDAPHHEEHAERLPQP